MNQIADQGKDPKTDRKDDQHRVDGMLGGKPELPGAPVLGPQGRIVLVLLVLADLHLISRQNGPIPRSLH